MYPLDLSKPEILLLKTIPPLTLQPNIANTQGSLPLSTRITTCYS